MITHDVKPTLKNHFGFNAFHTTTQNVDFLKSLTFNRRYRRKKALYEFSDFHGFIFPQTTLKNPYFTTICYNIAITYFKRSLVKCI